MTGRVLIVDDDPTHLMIAEEILQADGHYVVTNRTGFGTTMKVLREKPDVVLLDVNMPGLSGDAVAGLLAGCEERRKMAILLYSSNDEESLRKSAAGLGLDGFVMKGDPDALRLGVRRALAATRR